MRSTFKVLFYLKRNASKKNGLIPVMCRITVNGKIAQFSCKLDVEEKSWNVELGRVSGRSIVAQEANRMLDKIRVGIDRAYQQISDRDNYVTAEKVRNAYLGLGMNHETLLAVFHQHNEDYRKQVGKLKSLRSYWKYCVVYKHLSEFVEKRYKVSDIALKELTPAFITDFELFLRVEKNHCNNTVWSYMMSFRKIIYMAVNNGLLQRDPFFAYSITKEETKRGFLTKDEIRLLIDGTFKKPSYTLIRDLFIFCTFTGLSWTDMPTDTAAIWMTEAELVELFGTTAGAVYVGIKTISKENVLHDYDVCKCIRLDSGNSADVYNMEIVIALAFRLNTYPASVFRKWLVKRATVPRRTTPPVVIRYKGGLLN